MEADIQLNAGSTSPKPVPPPQPAKSPIGAVLVPWRQNILGPRSNKKQPHQSAKWTNPPPTPGSVALKTRSPPAFLWQLLALPDNHASHVTSVALAAMCAAPINPGPCSAASCTCADDPKGRRRRPPSCSRNPPPTRRLNQSSKVEVTDGAGS